MRPERKPPILRRFGRTGLAFPEIGFGSWTLSGKDFGLIDEDDAKAVLAAAWRAGVRFTDTADVYGRGRVERLIGEGLARLPETVRRDIFLSTKIGNDFRTPGPSVKNFTPDYLADALGMALERLGRRWVDLLHLHNPPPGVLDDDGVLERLKAWRSRGLVRLLGVSTTEAADLRSVAGLGLFDAVQIPFNLLRQDILLDAEDLLTAWGGAVVVRTPLEFGLLGGNLPRAERLAEGDYRRRAWAEDDGERLRSATEALKAALVIPGKRSLAQAAIAFALLPSCVSVVIPGARNAAQLAGNLAVSHGVPPLTFHDLQAVDRILRDHGVASDAAARWGGRTGGRQVAALSAAAGPPSQALFAPLRIGPMTLPNRLVRSGTTERCVEEDGSPSTDMDDLYAKLAAGGTGLVITGYIATDPDARASTSHCVLHGEGHAAAWSRVVRSARAAAPQVRLCAQLARGGALDLKPLDAGPSAVAESFARSAQLAVEAGFDAVQVHAAHGYLLSQRLAADTGEGLGLLASVVAAVRERIGPQKALLLKLNMDDFTPGGLASSDAARIGAAAAAMPVDGIEWSAWVPEAAPNDSPSRHGDPTVENEGFFVPFAAAFKAAHPHIAVGSCGGFRSAAGMAHGILAGGLDFVSLSRPFIAEPDLARRLLRGQARSACDGCNTCLPRHVRPLHCPVPAPDKADMGTEP